MAASWLPSVPWCTSVRTDTGTSARISRPSLRMPRDSNQRASAPETTVNTTSLTVPPKAFLTLL